MKNTAKEMEELIRLNAFNYMLLGRLQADLKYFWSFGDQNEKDLYYGNYEKHLKETIKTWKLLPVKPIWFRASEIREYKEKGKFLKK